MTQQYKVLIMGASYGSLLGTKMLQAGHDVTLVCTPATAELINSEGTVVRLPVRGRDELVTVHSKELPGKLDAATPEELDPGLYDLVVLGMQEPQYRLSGVRELLNRVAISKIPAMAIMNMPPLPYLDRLPGVDSREMHDCYADPSVWQNFDPGLVTLASPDPQAFRPPDEGKNVLQVSLPTNFKVARFESDEHTQMLRDIEEGIIAAEFPVGDEKVKLPVKLKVHDSLFVPLAKWSMLVTGNYRCVQQDDMRSIRDAVHSDIAESEACYQWVCDVCIKLGAAPEDMVPFEKYANAAKGLSKPSSAARALFGGSQYIERVDLLVQQIAAQFDRKLDALDTTVGYVNDRLSANRSENRKAS